MFKTAAILFTCDMIRNIINLDVIPVELHGKTQLVLDVVHSSLAGREELTEADYWEVSYFVDSMLNELEAFYQSLN